MKLKILNCFVFEQGLELETLCLSQQCHRDTFLKLSVLYNIPIILE